MGASPEYYTQETGNPYRQRTQDISYKDKYKQYLDTNTAQQKVLEGKLKFQQGNYPDKTQRINTLIPAKLKEGKDAHIHTNNRHLLRVKGQKDIFQTGRSKKQAVVADLISNKIDFPPNLIKRDGEGLLIFIKYS